MRFKLVHVESNNHFSVDKVNFPENIDNLNVHWRRKQSCNDDKQAHLLLWYFVVCGWHQFYEVMLPVNLSSGAVAGVAGAHQQCLDYLLRHVQ